MKLTKQTGFTIVEVIIVIIIIAILSTLAVITYGSVREDSRNTARESNAVTISEALERYYEQNGEYPSVASIVSEYPSNTGEAVSQKLAIPVESLITPQMPSSTSNALTSNPNPVDDMIAYTAQSTDNNLGCQNDVNAGCDQFTLAYQQEGSGETRLINSRRSSRESILKPELEVNTTSPASIDTIWSPLPNATSYELQRSLSSSMASPTTSSHTATSASATGLTPNTEYFFRVRADLPTGYSDWSDIQSATTSSISPPIGTITITAAMSGANARGTASGGTCASGSTIERQIRYQTNAGAWGAYTTGTPRNVAATEGSTYTFQARARCSNGGVGSSWSTSATASVTRPVTAPTNLTITADMNGSYARGIAGGGSCASGTTIQRQLRHQVNAGAWGAYVSGTPRNVAATSGYRYTFQQQARCVGANQSSDWVTSSTSSIIRPVTAPTGLTISAAMSGTNARGTAGGGSCPAGTTLTRQIRYFINSGSYVAWTTGSPRNVAATPGYRYTFQQQARCDGTYASSSWATSGTASTFRTVAAPTGTLSISAGMNGSAYARGTGGGGSCPAGTSIQREIRYAGSSTDSLPYGAYTSGSQINVPANQGWRYTFQQRARCVGVHASSGYTSSGTSSVVRPITTSPSRLIVTNSTSGNTTTFTATANTSCPTGATMWYRYRTFITVGDTYPRNWSLGHPEYNNPPHNWNSPGSTSRTATWNTSVRNRKYWMDWDAYCRSTHTSGPWMSQPGVPPSQTGESSYFRP